MTKRGTAKRTTLPTKLKDRYEQLENIRKVNELNEHRRRKMAVREALNHHLELERLKGLVGDQRMESLRHVTPRIAQLQTMIRRVQMGDYR